MTVRASIIGFYLILEGSGRKPAYTKAEEEKFAEELKEDFEKNGASSHMKKIKKIVEKAPPGQISKTKPKGSNGFISRFKRRNRDILGFLDRNAKECTQTPKMSSDSTNSVPTFPVSDRKSVV